MNLTDIKQRLSGQSNPQIAKQLSKFFKTGKGQYAEGDIFIGIRMPVLRKIAKKALTLPLNDIPKLLKSKIHEHRMLALLILIYKYQKADNDLQSKIFKIFIDNRKYVNNWDLVDISSPHISGAYLLDKDKTVVYKLAKSENLWDRRIAIVSTFAFIRNNQFEDTFKLAEILLNDKQDLIHKAVGWMLREIGKRDLKSEKNFLKTRYKKMPRTMLRYAIEKFDEPERQKYLKGLV